MHCNETFYCCLLFFMLKLYRKKSLKMKIIISPAKSLDYKSKLPTKKATKPQYLKDAKKLNNCLRQKSREELSKLMKISAKLADLNYERYQDFHLPFTTDNARPAVFSYAGDVY